MFRDWAETTHLRRLAAQQPHPVRMQVLLRHVGFKENCHSVISVDLCNDSFVPVFLLVESVKLRLHVCMKVRQPLLRGELGGVTQQIQVPAAPGAFLCVVAGTGSGRSCALRGGDAPAGSLGGSAGPAPVSKRGGTARLALCSRESVATAASCQGELLTFAIFASRSIDGSQNGPWLSEMCRSSESLIATASPRGFAIVSSMPPPASLPPTPRPLQAVPPPTPRCSAPAPAAAPSLGSKEQAAAAARAAISCVLVCRQPRRLLAAARQW